MDMRIYVSQLGPIKEAGAGFADLTVLLGESNSGKEFFAGLMSKAVSAMRHEDGVFAYTIWKALRDEHGDGLADPPEPIASDLFALAGLPTEEQGLALDAWERDALLRMRRLADQALSRYGHQLGEAVMADFEFGRGTFGHASPVMSDSVPGDLKIPAMVVENRTVGWIVDVKFHCMSKDNARFTDVVTRVRWLDRGTLGSVMTSCAPEIPIEVVDAHKAPSVLDLPISDGPIKHLLFPEWRRGSVADLPLAAGRDALSEGMPSGFWRMFRETMDHYAEHGPSDPQFVDAVSKVEESLGARFTVDQRGNPVVNTPFRRTSLADLSLDAGVRGIAPLLLFLAAGHTELSHLMIVEPELGLHPQQQIAVAELIGALVVGGVNVVVSTNSDYVVNAFNCMIRAASLESIGRHPESYSGPIIAKKRVRAAEFCRTPQGCTTNLLPIDFVDGISEETFSAVMTEQYDISARLMDELLYYQNEQRGTSTGESD